MSSARPAPILARRLRLSDGNLAPIFVQANLGVSPSLTICAIAERAKSFPPESSNSAWQDSAILDETGNQPRTLNI
ncbi:MAG TPA: hypothetical protein VKX49_16935 [Bryobacteraceae bacterium]|nr:hypothetical protein [Bryobacteraceae bacterium]